MRRTAGSARVSRLSVSYDYGLNEVLGFTQIGKEKLSENEPIFNSVFTALYTIYVHYVDYDWF